MIQSVIDPSTKQSVTRVIDTARLLGGFRTRNMNLNGICVALCVLLFVFNVANIAESALPFGVGVFPLLTSGWYYKPNPVESVIFGLLVVKVLAIRLASITGILPIPYHLNDLFVRNLGKRSLPEYFLQRSSNLTIPHTLDDKENNSFGNGSKPYSIKINETIINPNELQTMFRLLLGVRRMDTTDCFLKTLCFLGSETTKSEGMTLEDQELIETINYLTSVEKKMRKSQDQLDKPPIMDVFHQAIAFGMRNKFNPSSPLCESKYSMCSLSETDVRLESIISEKS